MPYNGTFKSPLFIYISSVEILIDVALSYLCLNTLELCALVCGSVCTSTGTTSPSPSYRIKPEYERRLRDRSGLFRELTKTNKTLVHTFITTYGVANGKNRSIVHSEVTMDDLFNS